MVILIHVVIALSSLALTTGLLFKPAQAGFRLAYGLIALTLVSGTYLIFSTGVNILHACTTGLIYLAVVSSSLVAARHRLAHD